MRGGFLVSYPVFKDRGAREEISCCFGPGEYEGKRAAAKGAGGIDYTPVILYDLPL